MQSDKRASFYTDVSKHHEFISRLKSILKQPDSSISNCYITRSTSDKYCLFITPANPQYDFTKITFDFNNFFSSSPTKNDTFYKRYMDQGLSKVDIDSLSDLLDEFAFENFYEGMFFASKFFEPELNPSEAYSLYFKFTADEKHERYFIDGKKVEKYYSVIDRENLAYVLNLEDDLDLDAILIKCNTYGFTHYNMLDFCIQAIKKTSGHHPRPENFVVEVYQDLEYFGGYIKGVFELVDDKLVEVDIKDIVNTTEVEED
jgi:hypothetical protein